MRSLMLLYTTRGTKNEIRNPQTKIDSFILCSLVHEVSNPSLAANTSFTQSLLPYVCAKAKQQCRRPFLEVLCEFELKCKNFPLVQKSKLAEFQGVVSEKWILASFMSNVAIELKMNNGFVRFSLGRALDGNGSSTQVKQKAKRCKMSKKAKVNELQLYRLKAKKKMNSPNPEVRIRYKLEQKEAWLIEKLRKFEVPKIPAEAYDLEILTEEEKHYLKRSGEKKKNYVPVGRRGVFGGVVLNMHLHWKKHETVKVICRPCKLGQVHEYAEELARLSKGILYKYAWCNVIILSFNEKNHYFNKNYVQPNIMSPPDTLSKDKPLIQSLEHSSQFIKKLEKELEEYHKHHTRYKKEKEGATHDSFVNT
ncbi:hypothetical protein UlMin_032973 [Ulmus minor]